MDYPTPEKQEKVLKLMERELQPKSREEWVDHEELEKKLEERKK